MVARANELALGKPVVAFAAKELASNRALVVGDSSSPCSALRPRGSAGSQRTGLASTLPASGIQTAWRLERMKFNAESLFETSEIW